MVGEVIAGKYRVLEELGRGGFGTVYLVEITAGMVGGRLALKLLAPEVSDDERSRELFLNEIRVAMRLVDKHIVQVRDVGTTEDGRLYYTMDYSPGVTLKNILAKEKRLEPGRATRLVLGVLTGLQAAHRQGVIHRDLKPANLMVEGDIDYETVRILDFGIATAAESIPTGKREKFVGSWMYTPPEQLLGQKLGFFTDLYAVGVVLYECVAGRRPYRGKNPQEVYNDMKRGPAALPAELAPELEAHPGLDEVILKALERNPAKRYQTARDFIIDLRATLDPTGARFARIQRARPRAERTRPLRHRPEPEARSALRRRSGVPLRRALLWAGTALLVLAGVGFGLLLMTRDGDEKRRAKVVRVGERREKRGASRRPRAPVVITREDPVDAARGRYRELMARATTLVDEGRVEAAIVACGNAAAAVCGHEELAAECYGVKRLRGLLELRAQLHERALGSLEAAIVAIPPGEPDPELHVALAQARAKAGNTDGALSLLRECVANHPPHGLVLSALFRLLEATERTEELAGLLAEHDAALDDLLSGTDLEYARALHERYVAVPRRQAEERARREGEAKRVEDLAACAEAFQTGDFARVVELGASHFGEDPESGLGLILGASHRETGDFVASLRVLTAVKESAERHAPTLFDCALELGLTRIAAYESRPRGTRSGARSLLVEARRDLDEALAIGEGEESIDTRKVALALSARARCSAHEGAIAPTEEDIEAANRALRENDAQIAFHQGKTLYILARRLRHEPILTKAITRLNRFNQLWREGDAQLGESYLMQGLCYYDLRRRRRDYIDARNKFIQAKRLGVETAESRSAWADCDIRLK